MSTFSSKQRKYAASAHNHAKTPAASDALVETMCLAACVDGKLEEGEAAALARQIAATPGFESRKAEPLAKTVKQMVDRLAKEGLKARVAAIAKALGSDKDAREEAFALATMFVLFDGVVGDEEQALLEALQAELKISDESAARISALLAEA
jgi:tellurite resistance protein